MDHSNLDRVLYRLNWRGRYQLTQLGLVYLALIPASLNILSYIFVGYDGPHKCTEVTNTSRLSMYSDHISNDSSIRYDECEIVIQSNTSQELVMERIDCIAGNTYNEHKQVSMVSDWDLVCERASMSELTQTVFVLGQAAGSLICSSMSDRFGRKFTYSFSVFMLLVSSLGLSFSPNYSVFIVFRFVVGIFQQGTDLAIATIILESVPTEKRFIAGTVGSCLWGTALVTLAPLAYVLRNVSWRYLQIAVSLTAVYSFILPFFLDETLRWLEANGKTMEIERILKKSARINKVPEEEILKLYHSPRVTTDSDGVTTAYTEMSFTVKNKNKDNLVQSVKIYDEAEADVTMICNEESVTAGNEAETRDDYDNEHEKCITPPVDQTKEGLLQEDKNGVEVKRQNVTDHMAIATKRYTLLDILKNKTIFINAVIMWYCWIVDSLVYYGLYMTSSVLSGNRYMNYFLNSVVEVPGTALIFLTLERFGRRNTALLFHAIAGFSLLFAVLLKSFAGDYQAALVMATTLSLVGKLTITTAFASLFIYTPELFPTNLRNAGLGAASAMSRLGGMVAPFAGTLEKKVSWAPGAIFTASCLLAGVLIKFLPETRGHELPVNMEEIREWYKDNVAGKKQKKKKVQQAA